MMCVHSGAYGLYVAHDQRYPANRYLLLLPTYLAVDDDLQAPLLDDEHVLPLLPLEKRVGRRKYETPDQGSDTTSVS